MPPNPSSNRRSQATLSDLIKASRRPVWAKDGKPPLETVSITAYYKRFLKPEFDAIVTLMARDAEIQRRLQPPNPHHIFPPQHQMHQQMPPQQGFHPPQGGGFGGGRGGPGNGPPKGQGGGHGPGPRLLSR